VRTCGKRYHPTKFHEMFESLGGLETANRFLSPDADFFSYGFERLCEMGKSDLTMEALILDPDYAAKLFSKKELDTARERLAASMKDLRVLISTGWGTITFARQATSVHTGERAWCPHEPRYPKYQYMNHNSL
jgi:hypothetical protein